MEPEKAAIANQPLKPPFASTNKWAMAKQQLA
jgi:hypothetical protein